MPGIEKTVATIGELGSIAVDIVSIVKDGGIKFSSLPKLLDIITQANALMKDAPASLPELTDLDAAEAAQVGAAAFMLVKKVMGALVA